MVAGARLLRLPCGFEVLSDAVRFVSSTWCFTLTARLGCSEGFRSGFRGVPYFCVAPGWVCHVFLKDTSQQPSAVGKLFLLERMVASPCSWVESSVRSSVTYSIPAGLSSHLEPSGTSLAMPPLRKASLASRPASDPIQMTLGGAEKVCGPVGSRSVRRYASVPAHSRGR